MSDKSRKGVRTFYRTTEEITAGNGEVMPVTAPNVTTGAWYIEQLSHISFATNCATHTDFEVTLFGAIDDDTWFLIRNGVFSSLTSIVEEVSCATLKYLFVAITDTSGAGDEAYTIIGRGVHRSEG